MAKKTKKKISTPKERIEELYNSIDPYEAPAALDAMYDILIDIYTLIQEHKLANEAEGMSDLGFALLYIEPWLDAIKKEIDDGEKTD